MTDIQMYLVGGAVRDGLLGVQSKDMDYSVVVHPRLELPIDEAYSFMRQHLNDLGFKIFLDTPEYLTIRAKFPKGHRHEKIVGDFVLARKDGPYSDGRRPDWVKPGTLEDDLARRDFSINAMALTESGDLIDYHGGRQDLADKRLRAVGDAKERLMEDPLRAFRAVRFSITKGFTVDSELKNAMMTVSVLDKMESHVSAERIQAELRKCFVHDTPSTVITLAFEFPQLLSILEHKGIWMEPTTKAAK